MYRCKNNSNYWSVPTNIHSKLEQKCSASCMDRDQILKKDLERTHGPGLNCGPWCRKIPDSHQVSPGCHTRRGCQQKKRGRSLLPAMLALLPGTNCFHQLRPMSC